MSNKLLYDIVQLLEWPAEKQKKLQEAKKSRNTLIKASYDAVTTISRHAVNLFHSTSAPYKQASSYLILYALNKLKQQNKWQFAICPDGSCVAMVQTNTIEVRSLDEESTVIGSCKLPEDGIEGPRCVAWSQDGSIFAVSMGSVEIDIFDINCILLSSINMTAPSLEAGSEDTSKNICSMMFVNARTTKDKWQWELLVFTYSGSLTSYFVSHAGDFDIYHNFNVGISQAISCALVDEEKSLLLIGGNSSRVAQHDEEITGSQFGITKWRILSDYPYYKRVADTPINPKKKSKQGVIRRISTFSIGVFNKLYAASMAGVHSMALSPDHQQLITSHHNGILALWNFPSLTLKRKWSLEEQPCHNDINPSMSSRFGRKRSDESIVSSYPFDVSWWNNEAVIISRCSGCLTIVSVVDVDLANLFGDQCEWIAPNCPVSPTYNERFYMLECNTETITASNDKKSLDEPDADDISTGMLQKGIQLTKHWAGIGDVKKKERGYVHKYCFTTLTKTTPQELYERKLDDQEFGEALSIAQAYDLDCDKVFQRQWRNSTVSRATIQDYLAKVENCLWVFRECLDRVPDRIDDAKELVEFALRVTDVDKLAKLANSDLQDDDEEEELEDYDGFDYEVQQQREMELRRKFEEKWLQHVDFEKLNFKQNEMMKCRQKILCYKDRLSTYQLLLGGYDAASQRYSADDFIRFRKRDMFQLALEYARSGNWEAVDILFQYHFDQLNEHRLPLLSNFSEIISPNTYHHLLPEVFDGEVSSIEKQHHRKNIDWCENIATTEHAPLDVDDFYKENEFLNKFRTTKVTPALASEWYQQRAMHMEKLSQQTDEALQLIELGIKRGISGLMQLHVDLTTLDNLVFQCGCDLAMSLAELLKKQPIERIRLMMAKSSPATFVQDIQQLVIPFVNNCNNDQLLVEYLIETAKNNLVLPFLVFKHIVNHKISDCNFNDEFQVIRTALDCIYSMEQANQIDVAYRILACLPKYDSQGKSVLKEEVSSLERNLDACSVLARHTIQLTPSELKNISEDKNLVLLLYKRLTRTLARDDIVNASQCKNVLEDMQNITTNMFSSIINKTMCVHILIESLLTSGVTENIRLAGDMMIRSQNELGAGHRQLQLPYLESVDLVLSASQEYFDATSIPLQNNNLLQLSRLCLLLITDQPAMVQERLELIEAVSLLSSFGLEILPLEVRLCKDRLEIVQRVLDHSPLNYKKIESILLLSALLNVNGDDNLLQKGRTLCLIVKKALENADFKIATNLASDLIERNYSESWKLCAKLGTCKEIADLAFRHSCISFASCYCDDEDLVKMTDELCKVTALLLEQALEDQVNKLERIQEEKMRKLEDSERVSAVTKSGPHSSLNLKSSADILAATINTTGVLLGGFSLWKNDLSGTDIDDSSDDDNNNDFETQGCPTFYKSIFPEACPNMSYIDYTRYVSVNKLSVTHQQTMLRINSLAGIDDRKLDNLTYLSQNVLTKDFALGIAYLLSIKDPKNVEECFQQLPLSSISVQLSVYYHALQVILGSLETLSSCCPVYRIPPMLFVDYAMKYSTTRGSSASKLQLAASGLVDYIQGETLSNLGHDIDVVRCMIDPVYMQETTHGLAMSTNEEQFLLAVLLAEQGACDVWGVVAAHVEYLFTETDEKIVQSEFFEKLDRLKILRTLVSREKDLFKRFDSQVFPLIDGRDHSTLLCYFSILKECKWSEIETEDSVNPICKMPPQTHIKYLRKLSTTAPNLDYKQLISKRASDEILSLIKLHINGNNIMSFNKMIPKIPYENYAVTQSMIILCWAQKKFWMTESEQLNELEWMNKLELCREWLQQLNADDTKLFYQDILSSQKSMENFSYKLRHMFLKFAISSVKKLKANKNLSMEQRKKFADLVTDLAKLGSHFSFFSTPFMQNVIQDAQSDSKMKEFLVKFDKSQSKPDNVLPLAVETMYESVEFTQKFLSALPRFDWTLEHVLECCGNDIIEQIRSSNDDAFVQNALKKFENLLSSINVYNGEDKNLFSEKLVTIVQNFCNDTNVDIKLKIQILQLLRTSAALSASQAEFLLFHRTSELIKSGWDDDEAEVVLKDIKSITDKASHDHIVSSLLHHQNSLSQLEIVASIVEMLQQHSSSSEDKNEDLWYKVLEALADHGMNGGDIIVKISEMQTFSEKVVLPIFDKLVENSTILAAVKFALITDTSSIDTKIHEVLLSVKELDETSCDDEILRLLIDKNMILNTLSTLYYHRVIQYLLSGDCENAKIKVDRLVRQLQDGGHISEAATLLLRYRGSHTAFATFGTSISLISDWLKKI